MLDQYTYYLIFAGATLAYIYSILGIVLYVAWRDGQDRPFWLDVIIAPHRRNEIGPRRPDHTLPSAAAAATKPQSPRTSP